MDKLAYHFNKKKSVDKSFSVVYNKDNKNEKYKVSPKVYKALKKRDKKEYYSDRRQFRHRSNFPTYYNDYEDIEDDAEYDPWWNYPDKKSYTSEDELCERLDREAAIANCSKTDKAIYYLVLERDYSQEETAEILSIDQATVSRKLKEIKGVLKRQFLTDGTNTKTDIDFYIAWEELCATGKTKNGDDVILEYILRTLTPKDLQLFLYWFYSLKELAKRLKITEDEFLCKRFFPFLSIARLKRYKEFIKKYKH